MVILLLKNRVRQARNAAANFTPGQKVVAGLFQSVLGLFMLFLFALFYMAFYYLKDGRGGMGAILYLLEQMFFLIFVLAVLSSTISSLYSLLRGREIAFLVTLPLQPPVIFDYLLVQNIVLNSWPVVIIGVPLATAYSLAVGLNVWLTMLVLGALLPMILLAEALGVLASLLVARFLRQLLTRTAVAVTILIGGGFAYYLADLITPSKFDRLLTEFAGGRSVTFISNSKISQPFLASHWVSRIYKFALGPEYGRLVPYLLLVVAAAGVALLAARTIGGRVHASIWQLAQESGGSRDPVRAVRAFPSRMRGIRGALVERDFLVFSRNSNELYQALFMFLLVLIFAFVVSKLPYLKLDSPLWSYRLVVFLFGAICYLLAMVSNRFVFPSLSLEGRSFWILLSSPLQLGQLYWAKLTSSVVVLSLLGGSLLLVSAYFYRIQAGLAAAMLLWVLAASVVVSTIALALGTLYPNFARQNPAELSSSLAGLLATVASLAYGAVAMVLLAPVAAGFYLDRPPSILLPSVLNLALSAAVVVLLSARALRRLDNFSV